MIYVSRLLWRIETLRNCNDVCRPLCTVVLVRFATKNRSLFRINHLYSWYSTVLLTSMAIKPMIIAISQLELKVLSEQPRLVVRIFEAAFSLIPCSLGYPKWSFLWCLLIGQITLTNQPAIGRSHIIYSESTTYESSLVYIATEPHLLKLHLITGINGYIVCVLRDFPAVDSTGYEPGIAQGKVQKAVKTFTYTYHHCLLSLYTYYDTTLRIQATQLSEKQAKAPLKVLS